MVPDLASRDGAGSAGDRHRLRHSVWVAGYLVRTQRDAVAAIMRVRGVVYYDWEWPKGGLSWKGAAISRTRCSLAPVPPWPAWLVSALGPDLFGHVVAVNFLNPHGAVDDALMADVGRLRRLGYLSLHNTAVTDDGLARLRDLTGLKTLDLFETSIWGPDWPT